MIETFVTKMQEVAGDGVANHSSDVPNFAKNYPPSSITSFDEANLPLENIVQERSIFESDYSGVIIDNETDVHLYIETRNQSLEGDLHPITGIEFEKKSIELPNGETVEGVFPKFPSEFEVKLNESQYLDSDAKQFKTAITQLQAEIENNPELAKKFTPEQLEQIKQGETPDGYVWHHSEEPGVLQLVDKDLHDKTGHTGGRAIWGGGSDHR